MKKQTHVFFSLFFILLFFCAKLTAEPLNDLKEFLEIYEDEDIPAAEKIVWFSTEPAEISITWAEKYPFRKDLRSPSPSEEIVFSYDAKEACIDFGFQYQANQLDFATHFFYMPTFYNAFQAGIGLNYHIYRYFKEFTESDFIGSFRFRWIRGPVFSFDLAAGYLYKIAAIDAIREYTQRIYNFSYHFDLILKWKIASVFDFWGGLKLQDYFDYPLAISPLYKIGIDVRCNPNLIWGAECTLKYVDMFFSAVYLNEMSLRLFCKVAI